MDNGMMSTNRDGRSLIVNLGDLPGLTALAVQERPERCAIWHPRAGDEAEARRQAAVMEQAAIYSIDEVIEFPLGEMNAALKVGKDGETFPTVRVDDDFAVGVWSKLLLLAAESAVGLGCRKLVWPIHLGESGYAVLARATELQGLLGHLFDLAEGTTAGLRLEMPFIDLTDARLIDLAARADAPIRASWWCVHEAKEPCGGCDGCRRWERGFKDAGIGNPWGMASFA